LPLCCLFFCLFSTVLSVLLSFFHCVVCSSVFLLLFCLFFCLFATVLSVLLSFFYFFVCSSKLYGSIKFNITNVKKVNREMSLLSVMFCNCDLEKGHTIQWLKEKWQIMIYKTLQRKKSLKIPKV
jgi:hypothetical protein